MQTDHRASVSLPLAHDHFRSHAKRPTAAPTVGELSPDADTVERPERTSGAILLQLAHVAGKAFNVGKLVTTYTIASARWSGVQSFRLASKIQLWVVRARGEPTSFADRFGESSQYGGVPKRLSALASLSDEQHALVRASLPGRRTHQAGSTLLAAGEQTPHPIFILSGWVARTRVQNGKLHVLGILLPGDGICLFGPPCALATTTLIALTTVGTAEASPVLEMVHEADEDSPLRLSMHRAMAEDEAFLLNHTMRLMMKPATARLAHLLLELQYRLIRVGLATNNEMPFALDRRMLAAALGLSPHVVGSVVRRLEQGKIAKFGHNRLVILRGDVLRKLAGFMPPAFSERPGRRLISDVSADDMAMGPGPWIDAVERRTARTNAARHRPA